MSLLFLSDVHASAARPAAVERLLALLAGPARAAERVYVLGDLFDQWLGDDDATPPHPEVEAGLRDLVAAGVPVGVLPGNHDFLLGAGFAARTGCRLLPDPSVIEVAGKRVVLMHGDRLCTDDADYQAFRRFARDPGNQRRFLARPLAERAALAAELRLRSAEAKPLKPDEIMDVNPAAVAAALRAANASHLVHGHTHRPAVHALEVAGRRARRTVLGDWYGEGTVGVCRAGALELVGVGALLGAHRSTR